jgi:GT2 family glycosyltransferase
VRPALIVSEPLVITVVLNTNRRDDTLACLASLADNRYSNHRVILLDNGSTDGSVAAVRETHPGVQVIRLAANSGYAGNNNVGIAEALAQAADWVFVLNEDTILHPDCLAELVRVGESDPRVGVVGPLVYHHSEPDVIQSAGGELGTRVGLTPPGSERTGQRAVRGSARRGLDIGVRDHGALGRHRAGWRPG